MLVLAHFTMYVLMNLKIDIKIKYVLDAEKILLRIMMLEIVHHAVRQMQIFRAIQILKIFKIFLVLIPKNII